MTKFIAHRGNMYGPKPDRENSPTYVMEALSIMHVEVDAWYIGHDDFRQFGVKREGWYLGHNAPQYPVPEDFLSMDRLWVHIKNLNGLLRARHLKSVNYFWHESDRFALTSKGYIWTCDASTRGDVALMLPDIYLPDVFASELFGKGFEFICNDWVGADLLPSLLPSRRRMTT